MTMGGLAAQWARDGRWRDGTPGWLAGLVSGTSYLTCLLPIIPLRADCLTAVPCGQGCGILLHC